MATAAAPSLAQQIEGDPIINDICISVGTANGSGSQTSNNTLMRALFLMGIPVAGKNLFPSNIQGLPTWFIIRANKDGWTGRKRDVDVVVCMNPETAQSDVANAIPGSVVIFDDSLGLEKLRDDVIFYPVPFKKLVAESCENVKLRKYVVNMIYVGVCCELFGIDMEKTKQALSKELKGKAKAIDLNKPALDAGAKWARENLKKKDRLRVEAMDKTAGKILITGNDASALGALYGGVSVVTWYPITPSSSLCEATIDLLEEFRKDPKTGKRTFCHVQGEDELASVGMAIGAGWAGARAMTATSGPGISLMSEFVGLAYYGEVPVVIGDVARVGPSTGLPTRTMQGDLTQLYWCSHGDTRHVVLIPGTVEECYEFWCDAFNIAEELQTPVFVMTDLDLGMNYWLTDRFKMPTKPMNRGKVLDEAAFKQMQEWGRYKDVENDGVGYRTLPGAFEGGAYFTRGSGHDEQARYTEDSKAWERGMQRLARKHETARKRVPSPVVDGRGAKVGIIAYGSTDLPVQESVDRLRKAGQKIDYLRVRALPFSKEVADFLVCHDTVYVIEANALGQMRTILGNDYPEHANKFRSILHYDGLPLYPAKVVDAIKAGVEVK
ncbi:MAG: 2-oxoacid:acceptor oxidoreductase subunit alpha [Planctomycetaceae bacterium]|nr:2-oxoacid:acceptor oxidoreductase subunit alpha [Planctomycetaceae bacterium]